jgi:hypothetical protein
LDWPASTTTRQYSPVSTLFQYMGSPGWMGVLAPSGRTGMNCSGGEVPSPVLGWGQYMKLVALSTRQVPGPKTL